MCGIAGIFSPEGAPIDIGMVRRMTSLLSHRGPDEEGYLTLPGIGLGQRRLSIIDLTTGKQPIHNEDSSIWVVFNGEIFNYLELAEFLRKKGHRFYTSSDTEVLVHLYEEFGADFLSQLNGQYAIALWDSRQRKLLLARDRVGICPLFYTWLDDASLLFASEMKALFAHPEVEPEMDPVGLGQIFSLWVNIPPRTVFENVRELLPGGVLEARDKAHTIRRYWTFQFPDAGEYPDLPLEHYTREIQSLLHEATAIRLRADVPVAAYLSGGIDSSIISALVKSFHRNETMTFSVSFRAREYDEKDFQRQVVAALGTRHSTTEVDSKHIGDVFPQVVYYSERPLLRTAPSPLFTLSKLVREHGIKVVLTGEGADEVFGGYNIFREDKVRRFWARAPESSIRPLLLSRLYGYVHQNLASQTFWRMFFKKGLTDTGDDFYSHRIRWNNTSQLRRLFQPEFAARMGDEAQLEDELLTYLGTDFRRWAPLCRAQYLEMALFLPGYLLSSQGDRMLMSHSVEGRFPFLDHRVIEFAATIPPHLKIHGLQEKFALKKSFGAPIPKEILERQKQPYRAPVVPLLTAGSTSPFSRMLRPDLVEKFGYFNSRAVELLLRKLKTRDAHFPSARDEMALTGIVSLHLLHSHFVAEKPTSNSWGD